jgi:hypothetical protein
VVHMCTFAHARTGIGPACSPVAMPGAGPLGQTTRLVRVMYHTTRLLLLLLLLLCAYSVVQWGNCTTRNARNVRKVWYTRLRLVFWGVGEVSRCG